LKIRKREGQSITRETEFPSTPFVFLPFLSCSLDNTRDTYIRPSSSISPTKCGVAGVKVHGREDERTNQEKEIRSRDGVESKGDEMR
jgi:hypothetical protein